MDLTPIQLLWFILIAVLWIGYLALEGFGFGVGMLLKILPKSEKERRLALNTIGPHWDGNEVWVLTAGGATFAAFPEWYATMFSGMYLALVLVLVCLIVRICAIEWRKQINTEAWRRGWDVAHTASSWIVSVLWGVAFANLVQGMSIEVGRYDKGAVTAVDPAAAAGSLAENHHYLTGGFLSLLTPFTLLGGLVTLTLFLSHGALYLAIKTTGDLRDRAKAFAAKSAVVAAAVTGAWGLWAQLAYSGNALSALPLALCALCLAATALLIAKGDEVKAFIAHFAGIAMAVVFIHLPRRHEVLDRRAVLPHPLPSGRHRADPDDHDDRRGRVRADSPRLHGVVVQGLRQTPGRGPDPRRARRAGPEEDPRIRRPLTGGGGADGRPPRLRRPRRQAIGRRGRTT